MGKKRLSAQEMAEMGRSTREYDIGQVCLNGHGISGRANRFPGETSRYCPECGEPTIIFCPKCQADIRGLSPRVIAGEYKPSPFCHECGEAYPWTERRANALADAIDGMEQAPEDERVKLKQSIPDMLRDTPQTANAAKRFGKAVAQWGGKVLTDVLTNVATEAALVAGGLKQPR